MNLEEWFVHWLVVLLDVYSVLFHIAGDLNSVETYLQFGPVVPFKVMCCLNAYFLILISFI